MTTGPNDIKERLTEKLASCRLAHRITFSNSALSELRMICEDWRHAEVYAGLAVLNALEGQKATVSRYDIKAVDTPQAVVEAIRLIRSGKDIWDVIRDIGNVPTMRPEGVQLKRALSGWDADRTTDSLNAVREGRLPQYALPDLVQYDENRGTYGGPGVKIPFSYRPSSEEVQAVAEHLACFVAQHTGEPHSVEDISRGNFGIQYFVRPQPPTGKDPLLYGPNYRVTTGYTFDIKEAQGIVVISREMGCRHDLKTLETYVQTVKGEASPVPQKDLAKC